MTSPLATLSPPPAVEPSAVPADAYDGPLPLPPRLLRAIAVGWAASEPSSVVAAPPPGERAYRRVLETAAYDVWVIRWGVGSGLDVHDHDGSAGVLHVVDGVLDEDHVASGVAGRWVHRRLAEADQAWLPIGHVHRVHNPGAGVATSVHVYSPPLPDADRNTAATAARSVGRPIRHRGGSE